MKQARLFVFAPFVMALLAVIPRHGNAQESAVPAISTERPTVGDSPDLIPADSLQIENGLGLSFQRAQYTLDLPESLIRYGVTEHLEIRFQTSDEVLQPQTTPGSASWQSMDPAVSVKALLGVPNGLRPRSGILALSFPEGGPTWTSGSYDPSATLIWTQALHKSYFLNEVAGATLTTLSGARRANWAPSIAGGRAFSESLTGFAEYAPTVLPNGQFEYVVDGGFALVRGKLTQIDVRTGYLRDSAGYHTLFSLGYSIRHDELFHGFGRIHLF
jgi:hypothetical protein